MSQLTTPVAYIRSAPKDPFPWKGAAIRASEVAGWINMAYSENGVELRVYSVGPDGTSHHGQVEYDPTNGVHSAGDIVERIPVK